MNNIKEILDSLWLENNESIVYLEAIKLWTVPASSIANKLNLPRTTIRYACESLVKKWLLISITKWNTKLFTAEHPNKIKNLLQVEKNKLEEKENKLNKVMSDMLQMYNPYTKLPKVTFYEWEEGIKKVLEDTLTSTEIIDSFADVDLVWQYIFDINKKYWEKRKKLNIKKRMIIPDTEYSKNYMRNNYESKNDILNTFKFLSTNEYDLYISFMIYDSKIAYITLEEWSYIWVIIENKQIYNFHKNMFKFIWNNLK